MSGRDDDARIEDCFSCRCPWIAKVMRELVPVGVPGRISGYRRTAGDVGPLSPGARSGGNQSGAGTTGDGDDDRFAFLDATDKLGRILP